MNQPVFGLTLILSDMLCLSSFGQGEKQKSADNLDQKQQDNKENVTPSTSVSPPTSSSYPGMMMPPWAQMPGATFGYNPFAPQEASNTRVQGTNGASQMRPPIPFAQFMAMQSMMQQQMRGMVPPQMMVPGWGMPGAMPGSQPGSPISQIAGTATNVPPTHSKPDLTSSSTSSSSSANATPSVSKVSTTNQTSASLDASSSSVTSTSQSPDGRTIGQGVRQRAAVSRSEPDPSLERPVSSDRSQALRRNGEIQAPSGLTQMIMAVLAVGILILLLRRLSMMGILRFDQNAEL